MLDPHVNAPGRDATDDDEDRGLLARIGTGDREALRALYVKHYGGLLRFMFSITRQLESAREGVNDVMLVVWEKGHRFQGRSKVRTWIMGIAYRKALKLADGSRRWAERYISTEGHERNEPSDVSGEPMRSLEVFDDIERALGRLPPKQRAVVELTHVYGHSYQEIAEIVNCPVNTVKTRMFHARAALKRISAGESE